MNENELMTLPHNHAAENAVLGSLLLDAVGRDGERLLNLCLSLGVPPEAFHDESNRFIYQTIVAMNAAHKPVDGLTLVAELRRINRLEAIGGAGKIQGLLDTVPTTANAEYYLNIVRDKYLRRCIIEESKDAIAAALDEREHPFAEDLLGETEARFLGIRSWRDATHSWDQTVRAVTAQLVERLDHPGAQVEGLSTGYPDLDSVLLGLKPGEMIVVGARQSVGKTSLAMDIAVNLSAAGHPVAIFSMEMPIKAIVQRLLIARAGLDYRAMMRGVVFASQRAAFAQRLADQEASLAALPLIVDDTPNLDISDLCARARRLKREKGVEAIFIDYLQLAGCREADARGSNLFYVTVTKVSKAVKGLARELNLPVVVLSQLNRVAGANSKEGTDDGYTKPSTSDLRESGAIEQDADVILLMNRMKDPTLRPGESDESEIINVNVAKNRNGKREEVQLVFDAVHTHFLSRTPGKG